jgi:hypothetical protein
MKQKGSTSQKKGQSKGKENRVEGYYNKKLDNIFEMKSHSFTSGSASSSSLGHKKLAGRKKAVLHVDI